MTLTVIKNHILHARLMLALLLVLFSSADSMAGTYIFASELNNNEDVITHPSGYTGSAGTLTVRVCIDPSSSNAPYANDMVFSVQNNINIYNGLDPTTGNLVSADNNNIPSDQLDFESVSLHEIGHCLGLGHVNASSESGLTGNNTNYTKATDGVNNVFDINAGPDGIIGSSDDIRGDDGNLHWFRRSNNNPFTIDNTVDSTTYARDLSDLTIMGHTFAANADRTLAQQLGVPNTEAVMQQETFFDEAQRTLAHDDVATLLYAASGKNENATDPRGGPNADNYTINLEYGGISAIDCDISLSFTGTNNLAFCSVSGAGIAQDHVSITTASIEFGSGYSWFFNAANQAPVLAPIGDKTVAESQSLSFGITATDVNGDTLQLNQTGLPPTFATLTNTGNGTATLNIMPAAGDVGTYPVTITVTDNGLPVLEDSETFDIIVSPANQAPVLAPIGGQPVDEEQSISVGLSATNPDGDTQAFTATGLPGFAILTDHGNDTATLNIMPAAGDAGIYPVTINVTDNGQPVLDDSEAFDIIVSPSVVDSDGDGLDDATELGLGTNPNSADTDGDGLADGAGGIVPLAAVPGGIDTDSDGFVDGEQDFGSSPLVSNVGDVAPRGAIDNVLNAADILVLIQLATGSATASSLEAVLGDINGIDQINVADVLLLQQLVLNLP